MKNFMDSGLCRQRTMWTGRLCGQDCTDWGPCEQESVWTRDHVEGRNHMNKATTWTGNHEEMGPHGKEVCGQRTKWTGDCVDKGTIWTGQCMDMGLCGQGRAYIQDCMDGGLCRQKDCGGGRGQPGVMECRAEVGV